jgi:uncharacterized protein
MYVNLGDIPPGGFRIPDEREKAVPFDFTGFEIAPLKGISVSRCELVLNSSGDVILLEGQVGSLIGYECDRCGMDVSKDVNISIREIFKEGSPSGMGGEKKPERGEEEVFFDGEGFYVEHVILENVLLDLPHQKLCREDCKGLCLSCGADWNISPCVCIRQTTDPRLEVLKTLMENKEK